MTVLELKKEIIERIDELPKKDIKELYDYVIFLEAKTLIPQIDLSQAYFWTKRWQKMEKVADKDIRSGRVSSPVKSTKELIKHLNKK